MFYMLLSKTQFVSRTFILPKVRHYTPCSGASEEEMGYSSQIDQWPLDSLIHRFTSCVEHAGCKHNSLGPMVSQREEWRTRKAVGSPLSADESHQYPHSSLEK
jgi:hypothetical protein